jgi:hypothetical protein
MQRFSADVTPHRSERQPLINPAYSLAITYMPMIGGRTYAAGGLDGTLLAEGGLSLIVCLLLLPIVRRWKLAAPAEEPQAADPTRACPDRAIDAQPTCGPRSAWTIALITT